MASAVFLAGSTGFLGRRLAAELVRRGHAVRALVRPGAEARAPEGCEMVAGDPLDASTYAGRARGCDTLVCLVGVAHPSPAKAAQFRSVDLVAAKAAVAAALEAGVRHFVYVSVAHPAPVMRAYIAARVEAEEAIGASGLDATILRPWYVLGPGRRWPLLLAPLFRFAPPHIGLVTDREMIAALANAVEDPPRGVRIVEVPQIRAALK